ncbi:hypothetical protein [Chitinophaga sancti]|uniref:hypothetical protein n=1 Tax=Chitinophaga sancti TaxID=1004 RepID=UPI003F79ED05
MIRLYADYRWGLNKTPAPTFTVSELKLAVEVAGSGGRYVVVHAGTEEGMRRANACRILPVICLFYPL